MLRPYIYSGWYCTVLWLSGVDQYKGSAEARSDGFLSMGLIINLFNQVKPTQNQFIDGFMDGYSSINYLSVVNILAGLRNGMYEGIKTDINNY